MEHERACVRARAGEAGRRLVTQQNARALPPRLRTLCFRAPARLSRDIYGKGGASQLFASLPGVGPALRLPPGSDSFPPLRPRPPPRALENRWRSNRLPARRG